MGAVRTKMGWFCAEEGVWEGCQNKNRVFCAEGP